jgi:hypothetical protein
MLLSMAMLVASVTLQVSVDDWPRSIDEGSAENDIVGAAGGAFSSTFTGGGGGGGAGGAFFGLQPAANIARVKQMPMVLIFRLSNMS